MKRITLLTALAALAIPAAAFSQQFIIDSFTTGAPPTGSSFNVNQVGVGSSFDNTGGMDANNVINQFGSPNSGRRIARAHITSGANTLNITNTAVVDQFAVSLGSGVVGHFHLYYGYNNYNPALTPTTQLVADYSDRNQNLSAFDSFEVVIIDPDHAASFDILLISERGGGGQAFATASFNYNAGIPSVTSYFVPFSAFAGINFADLDQIIVESTDLPNSADLRIDIIRAVNAVPEPTTLALIGLMGASGVGYARWRKRRKEMDAALEAAAEGPAAE